MSYKIMSFNIQNFSRVAAEGNKKDTETIAKIIRESGADIVAIQEVLNKEALKELLEKISQQYATEQQLKRGNQEEKGLARKSVRTSDIYGYRTKNWEGRWAKPKTGYGEQAGEGYAFIWNRNRIKLVTNYEGESFEPRIETFSGKNKLVRPPFIGRFMPVNGRFEFRLINTHIVFRATAKMKDENDSLYRPDVKDLELRREELSTLLDSVYTRLDKKQYDITGQDKNARSMPAYTFLLGDYNLNLCCGLGSHIGKELAVFKKDNWEIVTVNKQLTTLKAKTDDPKERNRRKVYPDANLANNYDHMSYDIKKVKDHQIFVSGIKVVEGYKQYKQKDDGQTQYDQYREKVSDHLPILLTVSINRPACLNQKIMGGNENEYC